MIDYIKESTELDKVVNFIRRSQVFGVDVEANGLDPYTTKVLLIQIGDTNYQYVLDVAKLGTGIYKVLDALAESEAEKVGHNLKYDYQMLKSNFEIELTRMRDTSLVDYLLTQGRNIREHNLGAVTEKYLGIEVSKEQQKSFIDMEFGDEFSEEQIEYAGRDVEYIVPLIDHLMTLARQRGLAKLSQLEFDTIEATAELELSGIFIDKKRWIALKGVAQKEADVLKTELDKSFKDICNIDLFGNPIINYNSPTQMLLYLPKVCDIELISTAEPVLSRYKDDYKVIETLLEYRQKTKLVSTYGEKFINDNTNPITKRIHSSFWQLGNTDSGRYASTKPNMQNIPKQAEYRAAFIAQFPDYRIISADFANQELRVLAHLSKEGAFLDCLTNGIDLHGFCAATLFDRKIESITPDERNAAKSINFGVIYGMGRNKLARELKIEQVEAGILLRKYFTAFPKIKKLVNDFAETAIERGYAYSPLDGRRRDLTTFDLDDGRQKGHAMNIAKNLPFQGAGASITKKAMIDVTRDFKKNDRDAKIINAVHDEILTEVHEDEAEETAAVVKEKMEQAFYYYADSVPMEVNPVIDHCWVH